MSTQSYPANAAERWLSSLGFERGNPFKTTNADEERSYLAETLFVPVPHYDRIRGPQTVLVFAPRGGGKSSLRVRLAAIALPEKADASTLAVECTDFEPLLPQFEQQQRVSEADFAALLLGQAADALLDAFTDADNLAIRQERAAAVPPEVRVMWALFVRQYAPRLLQATQVFPLLRQLIPDFWASGLIFKRPLLTKPFATICRTNRRPPRPMWPGCWQIYAMPLRQMVRHALRRWLHFGSSLACASCCASNKLIS